MFDLLLYVSFLVSTFILIPAFFATVSISWFFSSGVKLVARLVRARVTQRFDDCGAVWAVDDLTKRGYTNIVIRLVFKGTITLDQLRSQVQTKLLSWEEDSDKRRKFWRLNQRWTTFLGYLFWEPIPDFHLSQHVRLYDLTQSQLALPAVVTEENLNRISSAYLSHPTPKACPWELLLIPHYVPANGEDEPHCVILSKFHHALTDGTGILDFFQCLFDNEHEGNAIIRLNRFPVRTLLQKLTRTLSIALRIPFDFSNVALAAFKGQNEWISLTKALPQDCETYVSDAISLKSVMEIAKREKVNATAVAHALATGAILRMMADNGQKIGDCISFVCAYPLEGHPGGLTNNVTMQAFHFNPQENIRDKSRLKAIGRTVQPVHVTKSIFPTYFAWIFKSWAQLPECLIANWKLSCCSTAVLSFLPGPPDGSKFQGKARLVDVIASGGFRPSSCGCTCAAMSFGGKLRFTLNVDHHNLASGSGSSKQLTKYLKELLEELLKEPLM